MSVTETELKMLRILAEKGPISAANAGDALWGNENASGQSTCPYARNAGCVLKRLRGKKLSWLQEVGDDRRLHHNITGRGRDIVNARA